MDILKSKKVQLLIIGLVIAVLAGYAMTALGLEAELVARAVIYILGLAGFTLAAHTVTDVTSIIKGLQKKKTGS